MADSPADLWNRLKQQGIARQAPARAAAMTTQARVEIILAVGSLAYGFLEDKSWAKVAGFALGAGVAFRLFEDWRARAAPAGPTRLTAPASASNGAGTGAGTGDYGDPPVQQTTEIN